MPSDIILLGYFPKQRFPPVPWMVERGITQIGSVSLCMASGPDGWIESWKHNEWGFFKDPDTAWSVVAPHQRAGYRMYAFGMHRAQFFDGVEHTLELAQLDVTPLDPSFQFLGWDAVSRSAGSLFECSPLSCNAVGKEVVTNSACLFDDVEAARSLAARAEDDGCEPGPYYIVGVWAGGV